MIDHSKVEELRRSITHTYAWDFIWAEGDTIREKGENLLDIVAVQCLRNYDSGVRAMVIASQEICSLLSVAADMRDDPSKKWEWIPSSEFTPDRDVLAVGQYEEDCKNGYHCGFWLYQDDKLLNEELLVSKGSEVKLTKIFNYPFSREDGQ